MVPGTGGVPQFQRIPLPGTEFLEEEPLYVNAKQYRRILKRRQARAKLEAEGRIPKERPVRIFVIVFTWFYWYNSLRSNEMKRNTFRRQMLSCAWTCDYRRYIRFEVFMAVTMKNGVFWDVTPCGSCKNRRFGGT
jgi:hypothetical protein